IEHHQGPPPKEGGINQKNGIPPVQCLLKYGSRHVCHRITYSLVWGNKQVDAVKPMAWCVELKVHAVAGSQRSPGDDYSPPPCLYMSRQVHSVYTPPSMGTLEQASLPDIAAAAFTLPDMREVPGLPPLHHQQGFQQQPTLQSPGYLEAGEQSRYHLPFPWMKTTKSHSHTWKGQWT
ncbi:hypothetical protein ATANTOWER_029769, partial [Ataeniobius toweri]|nr:hypothetical protein [Ataeniobius toweri]